MKNILTSGGILSIIDDILYLVSSRRVSQNNQRQHQLGIILEGW